MLIISWLFCIKQVDEKYSNIVNFQYWSFLQAVVSLIDIIGWLYFNLLTRVFQPSSRQFFLFLSSQFIILHSRKMNKCAWCYFFFCTPSYEFFHSYFDQFGREKKFYTEFSLKIPSWWIIQEFSLHYCECTRILDARTLGFFRSMSI